VELGLRECRSGVLAAFFDLVSRKGAKAQRRKCNAEFETLVCSDHARFSPRSYPGAAALFFLVLFLLLLAVDMWTSLAAMRFLSFCVAMRKDRAGNGGA
jgi:hypothetical protein